MIVLDNYDDFRTPKEAVYALSYDSNGAPFTPKGDEDVVLNDDEFLIDDEHKLIHVRSASRVGHSDLGVNRKRVENIREKFQAQ